MPRSWRPGLRGIAVFGRCGAGASAMAEVYRRAAPRGHPEGRMTATNQAIARAASARRSAARNQTQ